MVGKSLKKMGQVIQQIKGKASCFIDNAEMEFIMPENQAQEYVTLRCPLPECKILYQIPVDQLNKKIRLTLDII